MNKKILIGIVVAAVIPAVAYAVSPLFLDTMIDEPLPMSMKESDTMMSDKMESDTIMPPKLVSGTFIGVGDGIHDAEGMAKMLFLDDGSQFLRLEDFRSTNGPDLYVYLATDKDAKDFVNLGRLKANIGNQNYEVPQNTDLDKYDTVLIWCQKFSVLFGSAKLA